MDAVTLTRELKARAAELGFAMAGACRAVSPRGVEPLARWLAAGYAGDMTYLADRLDAYRHPAAVLDGARSLLMLGMSYRTGEPELARAGEGRVSRYAWGRTDYHDVIHTRLRQLCMFAQERVPTVAVRGVVDTAPLLEREFAQLAGLGWVGKNTLLLNRRHGSWFFLATLLLDCELAYDAAFAADHCGTCTACLDACPTQAFPRPYVLDATRCISYLTIERRGAIPLELRAGLGEWLFGCDVCQDVCPWNRKAAAGEADFEPQPTLNPASLSDLFELSDEAFRRRFRHTPLWRARRRGLLRNAAIALGNQALATSQPALQRGLHDSESIVRGASAWALGQLSSVTAIQVLQARLAIESDSMVRNEIEQAIAGRA